MSTRCNIIVSIGRTKIFLYRHHDGYLAETGADLAMKLKAVAGEEGARWSPEGMADRFLRSMLEARYDKASYETEPRAVYELTNNFHGDIERCYWIEFGRGGVMGSRPEGFEVSYADRPRLSEDPGDSWLVERKGTYQSLAEFVAAVNRERAECNQRVREMNAKRKAEVRNWATADNLMLYEEYPMINLEKEVAA